MSSLPAPEITRAQLRRRLREQRRAVPPRIAVEAARRAAALAWRLPAVGRATRLACYFAVGGELSCGSLVERALRLNRCVYLPVLAGDRLLFAPWLPGTPLRPNRFGIPEPVCHSSRLLSASRLDTVVAPLVGFDETGNRLGTGGGWYDRTLSFMKQRSSRRRPHFVGLAFEFQRMDALRSAEWDVPMCAVVTDRMIRRFAPSNHMPTNTRGARRVSDE